MTITSEVNYISYAGTGAQLVFPYPFKIYNASDLKVYLRDAGPIDTLLVLNTHYTVDGVGVEGGGNVNMVTAPTLDQDLIIFRDPPMVQGQEYVEGGELPAVSHEDSLDKIVMEVQALAARAVRTPEAGAQLGVSLPAPALSPSGMYIRWNAAGEALEAVATDPVVTDGCPLEMVNALDYGDGTVSYATLAAAVAAIGAEERRLYLRRGTWPVSVNLNIGDNITLVPERGAILKPANGVDLDVDGPIEAGPVQIFDWTGTGKPDISGSPTDLVPIEWFGGKNDGTDNAAVFTKVHDCLGVHQTLFLKGTGYYKVESPVAWLGNLNADGNYYGFKLAGVHPYRAVIWLDVGAHAGFTIGTAARNTYNMGMQDVLFAGPANACTSAVIWERINYNDVQNVGFLVGSTGYAAQILGAQNTSWWLNFGVGYGYVNGVLGLTPGQMANNLYIGASGAWKPTTYNDLLVLMSGTNLGTYGLYMEGVENNWRVRGDIENVVYSVYASNCIGIDLASLHLEGSASDPLKLSDVVITGCRDITMRQCMPWRKTGEGPSGNPHNVYVYNSAAVKIDSCSMGNLFIAPTCRNVVIINPEIADGHGLYDLSGCAEIIGGVKVRDGYHQGGIYGQNRTNLIPTLLRRWQADRPDGWGKSAATTWTQTGTGLVDTTRHHAAFAAKSVVTASSNNDYAFSAEELNAVRGCWKTCSLWALKPAGQTFGSGVQALQIYALATAPNWSGGLAVKAGDAVKPTAGGSYMYVAQNAGTTHAVTEPTWPGTWGGTVVDNGITWVGMNYFGGSATSTPLTDAQDDDVWYKLTASLYVPRNATAASFRLNPTKQAAADGTVYIAEPCVHIGLTATRGVQQGQDEHDKYIVVGANRLWLSAAAIPPDATSYHKQGDVAFLAGAAAGATPGSVCTVSGVGAASTWKAMPVLAV